MNKVKVLFFATLRDAAGTRSAEIEVPAETTVQALKDAIAQQYPKLKRPLETALVAINREYTPDQAVVPEAAEVAFFPPVSGG